MITIDLEFRSLIPPLTPEELSGLEASVIAEGCRDALIVWGDILIDGHNRYEICQRHNIAFNTTGMTFDSREDAKIWIIQNQFSRRNLSPYSRSELALKLEPLIAAKAKERQESSQFGAVKEILPEPSKGQTRDELGKIAGVSGKTIDKVKKINETAPEEVKERLRSGEVTVNRVYSDIKRKERMEEVTNENGSAEQLNGKYRVIFADPPWEYGSSMNISYGTADKHYLTMPLEDICDLPIKDLSEENAVLFLWTTSPCLEDSFKVINAWGFKYKASFIWDKIKHVMGHYNSVRHELLLVATKGSCTPEVMKLFDSVVSEERTEHSAKPEIFRTIIDTIYPSGKRIELFARAKHEGWETWGNQA